MMFPTKALFGNLFILNIMFVFQEAMYRECKRLKTWDPLRVL